MPRRSPFQEFAAKNRAIHRKNAANKKTSRQIWLAGM
jgi:hypothetical protein